MTSNPRPPSVALRHVLSPLRWAMIWMLGVGALLITGPGSRALFGGVPYHPTSLARSGAPTSEAARAASWIPTQDSWAEQLRDPAYWAKRKSGGSSWSAVAQPSGLTRSNPVVVPASRERVSPVPSKRDRRPSSDDDDDDNDNRRGGGKTYRTMCVRLCDGFYWPISFATTSDNFEQDAATCARSCGGPSEAKLFTYRNPGGEPDSMEDLDGKPYKKLQSAFLFRTKYEPSCKCRAHPWEDASTDRHQSYALAAKAQKGDVAAAQQLQQLRTKMSGDARAAPAERGTAKARAARAKANGDAAALQPAVRPEPQPAKPASRQGDAAKPALSGPRQARADSTPIIVPVAGGARSPAMATAAEATDVEGAVPAAPQSKGIVILRFGSRPPVEVPVTRSQQSRRAADQG